MLPPFDDENETVSDIDSFSSFDIEDLIVSTNIADSTSEEELLPEDLDLPEDARSNLFPRAFNFIAQYFEASDVKNAFLVNKQWNRLTSASENCMGKLLLVIDSCRDDLLSGVLMSRRCYANLEISLNNQRAVVKKFERVLKKFSVTIVNLKITKYGGFNSFLEKPLLLLKLEVLELHIVSGRVSGEFLKNVCTLKKLTVNGLDPHALLPCLLQNPQLEVLTLYENAFICYFNQRIPLYLPFCLKSLAVFDHLNTHLSLQGELAAALWDPKPRINFFKFTKSQAVSLTSLHLDTCFADDLNRIIKCLPYLECLEVNKITGDLVKLRLEHNETITKFISSSKISGFLLFAIVSSCANLRSMFVHKLSVNHFLFVVRFAYRLENFGYFWANETDELIGKSIDLKALYDYIHQIDEGILPNINVEYSRKEKFLH